jgi:hypothetical protein
MNAIVQQVLAEKKAKSAARGRQLPPALADDRIVGTSDAAAFCSWTYTPSATNP